ncbi:hypothetical protein EGR_06424 [Echinococcus granulosus]|uniref:Uncharacterized protein n=1 Tax=Echinococcus granulosus TaxID=6210 RepID=W6UBI6_ECHGR|nr:hypothetical protein EGR_06424 [Echinococcus granulosus]EUB58753.1 hypothetical protein EGR_06424 [Echinococcus granulosus]
MTESGISTAVGPATTKKENIFINGKSADHKFFSTPRFPIKLTNERKCQILKFQQGRYTYLRLVFEELMLYLTILTNKNQFVLQCTFKIREQPLHLAYTFPLFPLPTYFISLWNYIRFVCIFGTGKKRLGTSSRLMRDIHAAILLRSRIQSLQCVRLMSLLSVAYLPPLGLTWTLKLVLGECGKRHLFLVSASVQKTHNVSPFHLLVSNTLAKIEVLRSSGDEFGLPIFFPPINGDWLPLKSDFCF